MRLTPCRIKRLRAHQDTTREGHGSAPRALDGRSWRFRDREHVSRERGVTLEGVDAFMTEAFPKRLAGPSGNSGLFVVDAPRLPT